MKSLISTIIFLLSFLLLEGCSYTYLTQKSVETGDYIEQKSLLPRRSKALTSDSVYVKGFEPNLGCFTAKDIEKLSKQIPSEYKDKRRDNELSFFDETFIQQKCIGFFYFSKIEVLPKKGRVRAVKIPCIKLAGEIYTNLSKGLAYEEERHIRAELSRYFDPAIVNGIIDRYKEGKADYNRYDSYIDRW